MILRQRIEETKHTRCSKYGAEHTYLRKVTIVELLCDNCGENFERRRGSMDPKRLNNNVFHVCSKCDSKRFAQKRGVEKKKVWELCASSNLPIGKL